MLNLMALQVDNPIVQAAWNLLLLIGVVGIVTTFIMQGIKKASMWIDSAHPALKQIIVVAIGEGLTILSKFFGVALPSDLAGFDVAAVQGLLAAGFAMGLYTVLKALGLVKPKE